MSLFPYDIFPDNSEELLAGRDSQFDWFGYGAIASFDADANWYLRFRLPEKFPVGTPKLLIRALANAVAGDLEINPQWLFVDSSTDLSGIAYTAEGLVTDLDWDSADDDTRLIESKVTLDHTSWVGHENDELWMKILFDTSESSLAADVFCQFSIIWEES